MPKKKTTENKIKGNTYNCFIEALNRNYEGGQKTGEFEESDAKATSKNTFLFGKKTIGANETVCDILKNGYKLPFSLHPFKCGI